MSRDTLTGSRIRERRLIQGMKQADLARRTEISASYLNLIEHNRRRIGGKLLLSIAAVLDVEASALSEGAEAALLASLREVAAGYPDHAIELDRTEDFAGRFPGWAGLIQGLAARQSSLEQTVVSISDRMTHDPQLAEALHDMLGAVTAIRSTSSILVETDAIEREWQDRFHRNINEDAKRLTESSQALVSYLNSEVSEPQEVTTPQDEIEAFFMRHAYAFDNLEQVADTQGAQDIITTLIAEAVDILVSTSAQAQVSTHLSRYWRDAQLLSSEALMDEISKVGLDPARIAQTCGVDLGYVMRRLASLNGNALTPLLKDAGYTLSEEGLGLVVCDSSGTLTFRKPLSGFALPRFGAACPLWVLYQALSRPMMALREVAELKGREIAYFETLAISTPLTSPQFGAVPLFEAHMLILPLASVNQNETRTRPIGTSCRICPRENCQGRREPSILAGGL